jgi:hypothetical protein
MIRAMDERTTMPRRRPRGMSASLICAVVMWLIGAAGGASPVIGQTASGWAATPMPQANGARMRTPRNLPVSRQSQLTLTVDTRWANNYGYRPVEVTISSLKPATADRLVTIRLHSGWRGTVNVEQDFELPLGRTSSSMTIAVPQYYANDQFFWWDVWIDGIKDRELSLSKNDTVSSFGGNFGSTSGLSFLTVGPFPGAIGPNVAGTGSPRTLIAPNTFQFDVLSLWISEFPKRWIDYTCLDVVLLSWGELQLISQTNPAAFEALGHWLRAGGQLWVEQVGNKFEELGELSKMFRLRGSIAPEIRERRGAAQADSGDDSLDDAWQPVRFRGRFREGQVVTFLDLTTGDSRVVRDPDEIMRLQNDPNAVVTDQQFEPLGDEGPQRRWPLDSSEWFVEQRLGLGVVRAFRATSEVTQFSRRPPPADPNAAIEEDSSSSMPQSLATALRATDRWNARHGMAPDDVNRDFVNLLVPGVGLAPVTEFRVLITVFVLLIGPVNYWLLKRWRRLHLLVLTVPLAAVLLTTALFGYAVVADGFGTTVRAHSFTTLDQRTGEAACWSRLSYYSGLAPRSGLRMPADVVIYPINPAWNASSMDAKLGSERDLIWDGEEARLTRGWLRSRTPTQFLTIRSRNTPHRLELAAGGGKLRATNRLGTTVDFALVVDRAGELWIGNELSAGSVVFLKPIARTDAIRRFRQIVLENEPQLPAALAGDDSHYAVMQQRQARQMFRNRFGPQSGEARLMTSVMNEALDELAGLAGRPALALPPRSYVAVTATGPEVELGMRGAEEDASFHVIVGQW